MAVLSFSATGVMGADILFISSLEYDRAVGDSHMEGDDALKAFLEGLGHTVTYFDDNESEADTEAAAIAADLVFISETVGSGDIRNEITEIEVPMVVTDRHRSGHYRHRDSRSWTLSGRRSQRDRARSH